MKVLERLYFLYINPFLFTRHREREQSAVVLAQRAVHLRGRAGTLKAEVFAAAGAGTAVDRALQGRGCCCCQGRWKLTDAVQKGWQLRDVCFAWELVLLVDLEAFGHLL